jgi:hypothetical protein
MGIGLGIGINRSNYAQGIFGAYQSRVTADGGVTEAGACVDAVSGLLLTASLLLIPSGYKSGKAYAQIPTNGNGDLTWTRASTALRTNSTGLLESMGSGVPRLSYTYGSCPALLLEPQRTNLALYSEQINNPAFWAITNSGTISANNEISPDGTQNADTLTAGASNSQVQGAIGGTSGTVYTVSIYVKRISGTGNVFLRAVENANTLISVTNEWQRFTATVTSTSTTIRIGIALATSGDAVAIWGGQLELGAYPTTYIPTTTASATRVADSFSRNNIYTNGLITSSGGTWFVELRNTIAYVRDSSGYALFISTSSNGFGGDGFVIYNSSASSIRPQLIKFVGGSASVVYSFGADNIKLAIKWDGSTADVFANGTKVVSATSYTSTLMQFIGNGTQPYPTFIQAMGLHPTPLTDAQCIELTTL